MSKLGLKVAHQVHLLSRHHNSQEPKVQVVFKYIRMIKVDLNLIQVDRQQSDLWLLQVYLGCKTYLACLHLAWHLPNQGSLSILTHIHTLILINNLQEMLVLNNPILSNQELAVLVHK